MSFSVEVAVAVFGRLFWLPQSVAVVASTICLLRPRAPVCCSSATTVVLGAILQRLDAYSCIEEAVRGMG